MLFPCAFGDDSAYFRQHCLLTERHMVNPVHSLMYAPGRFNMNMAKYRDVPAMLQDKHAVMAGLLMAPRLRGDITCAMPLFNPNSHIAGLPVEGGCSTTLLCGSPCCMHARFHV